MADLDRYAMLRAAVSAGAMILANEGRHGRPDQYHALRDPQFTCEPHEYIAVVPWQAQAAGAQRSDYTPVIDALDERVAHLQATCEQRRSKMERKAAAIGEIRPWDERSLQFAEIRLQEGIALRDVVIELVKRDQEAQGVFDCILRGVNDYHVSPIARSNAGGWLRSWAKRLLAVGFRPSNPTARDIRGALDRLGMTHG